MPSACSPPETLVLTNTHAEQAPSPQWIFVLVTVSIDDHDRKHRGEERVYYILQRTVHHLEKLGQELEGGTDAETREEC